MDNAYPVQRIAISALATRADNYRKLIDEAGGETSILVKVLRAYWKRHPSFSYRERKATGHLIQEIISNARYELDKDEDTLEVTMLRIILGRDS